MATWLWFLPWLAVCRVWGFWLLSCDVMREEVPRRSRRSLMRESWVPFAYQGTWYRIWFAEAMKFVPQYRIEIMFLHNTVDEWSIQIHASETEFLQVVIFHCKWDSFDSHSHWQSQEKNIRNLIVCEITHVGTAFNPWICNNCVQRCVKGTSKFSGYLFLQSWKELTK